MGVWIEMDKRRKGRMEKRVTPFMGVWIEIILTFFIPADAIVTPFMGVWIEMIPTLPMWPGRSRHTLYGCVD